MTDTLTIRPTPVTDLEPGMCIYELSGAEVTEVSALDLPGDDGPCVIVSVDNGMPTRWPAYRRVGVIISKPAPEAEPESAWPTEPIIRVLDGHQDYRDIGGMIALRTDPSAYRMFSGGSDAGCIFRDSADDEIEDWEALSVVPAEAIRALTSRLQELGIASPLRRDAAMARVVDAAEDLVRVADIGESS